MNTVSDVDEDLLSSWSFVLPEERIARHPLAERSASRLLHLDRYGELHHRKFTDVVDLLDAGDLLVVNDTTVLPARLIGEKAASGGKVEVLLVRPEGKQWVALVHASKKPKRGMRLVFPRGPTSFDALLASVDGPVDDEPGAWRLWFEGDVLAFARAHGQVPLPPYLNRAPDDDDGHRYRTVFRDDAKAGSSAAPTAGLHFDDATLQALANKGVGLAKVTLHVGPGTFLPVHSERLSQHPMHAEPWWLSSSTAALLNQTRAAGKRVVAVGTTAARVLESARAGLELDAPFKEDEGLTRLFIRPPHEVSGFDALLTNFHLPESTLLVLVGTLVGRRRLLDAYATAVREGYRFYSYGDCCFIEP
ncbi:MAG: tRNA preQ1(34) S-adenosylmethionine ribosyltransferase-isomerase QueA [Deltaproteobacteria bacterium]|nr:tRNA preQ1(34) S-adenosylmethionine ribosyltransferase-isomerase QueA [Deltaproteobacteria bacterium]